MVIKMNVPKLRFDNFSDDWQNYYVGNLCKIQTGKSNTQDKVDNGKYPFYVRSAVVERSNKYIFDTKAVLTVGDGVGTGKVYHYINGKFDCHQRVYVMNKFRGINAKYFYYLFSRDFIKRVQSMTAKTSVDSVRYEMIDKMRINIPSMEEQEKIANFLTLLDRKIELQSKKFEALKLFKKGLISKLFNGYKYEIMKIKDVLDFEQPTKYIVDSDDYVNDTKAIPVLTANKAFILGYCNEKNYYDKGESIIFDDFTMDMKYTNFNYKVKSSAIKILTAKENNDLKFLYELLLSLNLTSEEHKRHYISIVQEIDVKIPNIEIQKNISSKLKLVDNKILLEEKFLDNLTKLKKGLMQSMFV